MGALAFAGISPEAQHVWDAARDELTGLPAGAGLNIAFEAVDRHAAGPESEVVAIRWLPKRGTPMDLTYADLARRTSRFANVLEGLGVATGDRVFVLAGRIPELYVSVLGTVKRGAVACTLFSAFGPEPIKQRLQRGDAKVLVTTRALYEKRVASIRAEVPTLDHVLIVGDGVMPEGTTSLEALLAEVSDEYTIAPTDPEQPALLHFTSGTTGTPKGAVHVHEAV
ncbi:MAG TPA: AMP-binding protein, partial [Acidimicrobiales bacterium]